VLLRGRLLEPLPELAVIDQAGLLANDGTSFEHDEVRDAADLKPTCQLGMAIGIDLQHQRAPRKFVGHALDLRSRHATGTAPCRPKIHQDRYARLFYDLGELVGPDVDGGRHRSEARFASATFGLLCGTGRGDTVLSTTLGTHHNQDSLAFWVPPT